MVPSRRTIIAFLAAWCWTSEGLLYDVACPGVNSELTCSEGQVIRVLHIDHGDKSDADCNVRTKPGKVSSQYCLHKGMLPWVRFVCDGLERCRLPKSHPDMFVCGNTEDDFLQITYLCLDRNSRQERVVACDGKDLELKCETGAVTITRAKYGRVDENTCTDSPSKMTFCLSPKAFTEVVGMCDGKKECKLPVNSENLGVPSHCDKKPKYLMVDYICQ